MNANVTVTSMTSEELSEFMDTFKLNDKTTIISFPSVITYENGNIYKGEILPKTNCPNGYGIMHYVNGDWFATKWIDNLANGSGVCIYANGTDVRGTWNTGVLQSIKKGKINYTNGDIYVGPLKNNIMYGVGSYWSEADGELFHGTFVNGTRTGYGVSKWLNGSSYTGNWANDTFDGHGILITPTKKYLGPWCNGTQHKNGKILDIVK